MMKLSIRAKIIGFIVSCTIAFGVLLTLVTLHTISNFKKETIADFTHVLETRNVSAINSNMLIAEMNRNSDEATQSAAVTFVSVVSAAILLVAIGAVFIAGRISKPIVKVADALESISSGRADLTLRLPAASQDETGKICQYFNVFLERLQIAFRSLQEDFKQLNTAAESIHTLIQTIQEKTTAAKTVSQTVYRSAGYQNRDMIGLTAVLEESNQNFHTISSAVEQLTATVSEIAGTSAKAHGNTVETATRMERTLGKISELGQAADQIGKVTETITEISEQVNLLALNATIEAARAGTAGKGFAVVANEIKELAHQVAKAATEIKSRIEDVQTATQTTINEIEESADMVSQNTEIVASIASAVEEQSATVNEIASSLSEASEKLGDSNQKISKASVYAGDMAEMSNGVTDAVILVDEAVDSILQTSDNLQAMAKKSFDTSREFKI